MALNDQGILEGDTGRNNYPSPQKHVDIDGQQQAIKVVSGNEYSA